MLERAFDLHELLEKGRIMLSFKGDLSPELITALLNVIEVKMEAMEADGRLRKRVFNVAMECLQNLYHHNAPTPDASMDRSGVVMIMRTDDGYRVLTGNSMRANDVTDLKGRLDSINALDAAGLRGLYLDTLNNGQFGRAGGGGLGIIDIARKSGQKLEYGFEPRANDSTYFSLNVNLSPDRTT